MFTRQVIKTLNTNGEEEMKSAEMRRKKKMKGRLLTGCKTCTLFRAHFETVIAPATQIDVYSVEFTPLCVRCLVFLT